MFSSDDPAPMEEGGDGLVENPGEVEPLRDVQEKIKPKKEKMLIQRTEKRIWTRLKEKEETPI